MRDNGAAAKSELGMTVRRLGLMETRKFAIAKKLGADADALWPGWKNGLVRSLIGPRNIVVAAFGGEGADPIGWAGFGASPADRRVWVYGNLFTLPAYRRQGIDSQVVRAGADLVRSAGGERIYCYLEQGNVATRVTHERIGFCHTGFVKSLVGASRAGLPEHLPEIREIDGEKLAKYVDAEIKGAITSSAELDAVFMSDRLAPSRPIKPWKTSSDFFAYLTLSDSATLYLRMGRLPISAFLGQRSALSLASTNRVEWPRPAASLFRSDVSLFHAVELPDILLGDKRAHFDIFALDL